MAVHPDAAETLALLDALQIPYRYYSHSRARTMADCAGIGADVGAQHFKNLFLSDRRRSVFVLLLLAPEKTFHTADISAQLGTARLSFCTRKSFMQSSAFYPAP